MLLERFYDDDLAQASYIIACQASGEALVVDPRRDVETYLEFARERGLRIAAVTETHIHADYLSGTRELSERAGARAYVSDEGGPDWRYGSGFDAAVRMRHGDEIVLGNVVVTAVHTPGHTPEHLSFLITDRAQASAPGFMLTGDFVFVGDLGRPDLLDKAAGDVDTRYRAARDLFASLRDRFLTLPDYVQVLPAHGSGSACGRSLGSVAETTVGYERAFAWWAPFLRDGDEAGFVAELLRGQPDAPAYFARMKRQNREGPALLGREGPLAEYSSERLRGELERDAAIFVDTRPPEQVRGGTVPRSLSIPGTGKTASYGAWAYDPEAEIRPLVVLAAGPEDAGRIRDHLLRVGIDSIAGYSTSLDGLALTAPRTVAPSDLAGFAYDVLLDVRNRTEYDEGHLPDAVHLAAGRALAERERLSAAGTIVTYCRSGARNSVISSALRRAGCDVVELEGSYVAWAAVAGHNPVIETAEPVGV